MSKVFIFVFLFLFFSACTIDYTGPTPRVDVPDDEVIVTTEPDDEDETPDTVTVPDEEESPQPDVNDSEEPDEDVAVVPCSNDGEVVYTEEVCGSTNEGVIKTVCEDGNLKRICTCDPGEYPNYCGTFAQRMVFHANTVLNGMGVVQTKSRTLSYFKMIHEQQGSHVDIVAKMCYAYITSNQDNLAKVTLPQKFTDSLHTLYKYATITKEDNGTFTYHQPKFWEMRGATLENIDTDTLPSSSSDSRVEDWDEDGNPGLTTMLKAFSANGDMYILQRNWTIFDGTIDTSNPNMLTEGVVQWNDEQVNLGSSSTILKLVSTQNVMVTGDFSSESYFQETDPAPGYLNPWSQLKIDASWECKDIRLHADTLFGDPALSE